MDPEKKEVATLTGLGGVIVVVEKNLEVKKVKVIKEKHIKKE